MKTGEVVGLLGPNGAGKTTLFYMIVGFVHPDGGNIFLDGEIITKTPMFRRAQAGIAYLPQEESVFRKLSVEQNIWAVLEARKDITGEEKIVLLNFLLQELGVTEKRKQKAYTLSGGERRRTEIARALAMNPRFLLLDEPFTGIDPKARFEIKNIISRLGKQGIGVLITDHNERDTMDITHRSNIIYAGEIVVSGSREELMNNELARKIYLGEEYT
ncbi:hypothetical protein LSH36_1091g00236 [Paralvinella palmiformis]|uniref:ABC transporter domain-containing protein n=1 Tax=Paralvinella palmiformis TaxID=53620 RepID=A0AAD9IWC3_9ANNE|nr:hypothetical protein LSH36_1091g00236 [Paralvinella palmiformis]